MALIKQRIQAIQDDPYAYAILNGDLINNATRTSVSDVYAEKLSPMEQVKQCVDILSPIKDRLIAATSGNHCLRTYKTEGIDIMHFVCAELGIADNYDFNGVLVFLRLGSDPKAGRNSKGEPRRLCYTIYCTHGSGGGRTVGAKANALERRGDIINSDVCVVGHTHTPMVFRENALVVDKVSSTVRQKETVYVNTGSTLEWGGYSERMGLRPSSLANPVITLYGDRFGVEVTL